ncbi:MAG: hypothetical protein J5793_05405, partial [Clostridia bacterium]|nr:hypothetical protein [Clostridia bacterium]
DAPGSIVPPGKGKAGLAEILKRLDKDRPEGTVILTMEPHLTDFTGLASLANAGAITHKYRFDTPYEAFEYAFFEVLKMVKD